MKLNHECVRALLLYLEENHQIDDKPLDVREIKLPKFSEDEVRYSAEKLIEADFLDADAEIMDGVREIYVNSITWAGHQFLDNIRDPKIWKYSKSVFSKFASVSIGIIENVSAQVITNLISNRVGLPPDL